MRLRRHFPERARALGPLALALALGGCDAARELDPDPRCETIEGQVPEKLTLRDCADQHAREISCWRATEAEDWGCSCMFDGKLGRTFTWPATMAPSDTSDRQELESFMRRHCNWSLSLR